MSTYDWYQTLRKPKWAPPGWIFGPVWGVLYIIIAVSFGFVAYQYWAGTIAFMVLLPFILNLIFNFAFTPLQFGLKSNLLASVDILAVMLTIIWAGLVVYPLYQWVVYVNTPYFLWVSFASVLQLTITAMNISRN